MPRPNRVTSKNLDNILENLLAQTGGGGGGGIPTEGSDEYTTINLGANGSGVLDFQPIGIGSQGDQDQDQQDHGQQHQPEEAEYQDQEQDHQTNSNELETKISLLSLTNGWNEKNERILISIGENAASYKWMHERCSTFYKTLHRILSLIMIIFSTSLSAETLIPQNNSNSTALDITQRVFTYLITLLSVLQNFLKYEQLSERHTQSASAFAQLYHEIQQQMCMYRKDRNNATKYMADILKRYDTLIVNGPDITNSVLKKFKETFKNSDISVPDIADKIQKIEIISEPPPVAQKSTKINLPQSLNAQNNQQTNTLHQHQQPNLDVNLDVQQTRKGINFSNLHQIHSAFQIQGDISDHDIQQAQKDIQLKELRKKYLKEKSNFEYNRYISHEDQLD